MGPMIINQGNHNPDLQFYVTTDLDVKQITYQWNIGL